MANTIFILGAGASKTAGAPLMAEFLDVSADLLTNNRVGAAAPSFNAIFAAISALQSVHSKSQLDIQNIESVFAAFEMADTIGTLKALGIEAADQLRSAMKAMIVTTLESTIRLPIHNQRPVPPPPYEGFVELLARLRDAAAPRRTVAVITFNYDLSLDYTFFWKGLPVWYGIPENRPSGAFPVFKLHGSLNWAHCAQCSCILPWMLHEFFSNRHWDIWPDTKTAGLDVGSCITEFRGHEHTIDQHPFVVPPTWSKSAYYPLLAPVWSAAATEMRDAENIVVIGYSLPESDYFFRYMYALSTAGPTILKKFWVFNPDTSGETERRFRELLGPSAIQRFEYFPTPFADVVIKLYGDFNVPGPA